MLHNGLKYCAVLATMALISAAACSDDETTTTTASTTTTTTGSGGSGGGDVVAQCTDACSTLYDCGLEADGADQLCPGFSGDAAEKTAFVGDEMSGCVQNCIGLTALIGLIDSENCPETVSQISGASPDFDQVCENGFSQGGGGAGGGTGGAGGGTGGAGGN